jgi:NAD(P)-dependent dehydrogenase (short-subunit alcohol dehydrogenase family)
MRQQNYGRIVMTTSSSGMYGNFGQSSYGAAKMAVLGLMNTLVLEGAKNNICVNALAPTAGTRMTENLIPEEAYQLMTPESVTAAALVLCHGDAPNRMILCAGAGGYASTRLFETDGIFLPPMQQTPEAVEAHMAGICDTHDQAALHSAGMQTDKFVGKAIAYLQSQQ